MKNQQREKPKIFLSYAHEDIGMAKKIYNDLQRFGLDVWIDCESLLPGQQWKVTIEKAIKTSQYYLLLLSSHSVTKRGFIQKEMKVAYEVFEQCSEDDIYIIPVRLDECEPSLKISEINWIDVFPESKYAEGLKKILKVVNPEGLILRSEAVALSEGDAAEMIRKFGFFDRRKNPESIVFNHKYITKTGQEDNIVIDKTTGLIWQRGGSLEEMQRKKAKVYYIKNLNKNKFAGYNDWRLPTLEEAMSLMRPERNNVKLFINSVFDFTQYWIWTSDLDQDKSAWVVDFSNGDCFPASASVHFYVRAVRSIN
ncbi:MAG: DUF1566 domain-containing protein [Candidatus Lokiarchaeota archaeon]|nr:DUF1566 domain-containing protein [Candidatus Lokiarchaeota archaeon]